MKRGFSVLTILFLVFVLPFFAGSAEAAKLVSFGSVAGSPGDTVTVPVNVSNLEGVAGYFMSFTYDPAILTATGASIGENVAGTFNFDTSTDLPPKNRTHS